PGGTSYLLRPAEEIRREFRPSVLDQPRLRTPMLRFPTPPGTRGQHVTIRFVPHHQDQIQVCVVAEVCDCLHHGMQNARKNPAEPDRQWLLLVAFAENRGVLRWRGTAENRRRQKQKENLSMLLRAFFGLDEDPFGPLED